MRIAHLTTMYPLAGYEHWGHAIQKLVQGLQRLNETHHQHELYVFLSPIGTSFLGKFSAKYRSRAEALRKGPCEPGLHHRIIPILPKGIFSEWINPFWQRYILPNVLDDIGCDLIHVHMCAHLSYGAAIAGKRRNIPVVLTMRREMDLSDIKPKTAKPVIEAAKMADFLISPSAHLAAKCHSATGRNVQIIPSGTDIIFDEKPSVNSERKRRVLFVGTLEANKGILPLVNAVVRLFKSGCNFELFIIGQGPLLAELKSMVAGSPQVRFLGQIESIAVRQQMREAQILCAPSYTETLGLVFIEAMKQAMAVIGRKDTGIDGMGTAGRDYEVIEKDDNLAETLRALLDDDSRRIEIATNGQRLAAKWTWENSVLQHNAVYNRFEKKD